MRNNHMHKHRELPALQRRLELFSDKKPSWGQLRDSNRLRTLFAPAEKPERSKQAETGQSRRRKQRETVIVRMFDDHMDRRDNTQTSEAVPYLQVVAVFPGLAAAEEI